MYERWRLLERCGLVSVIIPKNERYEKSGQDGENTYSQNYKGSSDTVILIVVGTKAAFDLNENASSNENKTGSEYAIHNVKRC